MRTILSMWVLALVALCGPARDARAQQRMQVPDRPTCPTCMITLARVATLGAAPGEPALDSRGPIVRDSRGRLYVGSLIERGKIAVYDSTGHFLRTIGTVGNGPGEFLIVLDLAISSGDTLHVFGDRHSVLSPAYEFVRSAPYRGTYGGSGTVFYSSGAFVMGADRASRDGLVLPLHLLNAHGGIVRSFGAAGAGSPRSRGYNAERKIAPAGGDRLWAGLATQYQLELWDSAGTLHRVLTRSPAWFQPWETRVPGREDQVRPMPMLRNVRQDAAGHLWTLISVADAHWTQGSAPQGRREPTGVLSGAEKSKYYDSIIEVLDPQAGRLIASTRFGELLTSVPNSDLVYTYREDAEGNVLVDLWRVQLTKR
jgi:hypothetical protein